MNNEKLFGENGDCPVEILSIQTVDLDSYLNEIDRILQTGFKLYNKVHWFDPSVGRMQFNATFFKIPEYKTNS